MQTKTLLSLLLFFSVLLISLCIIIIAKPLHLKNIEAKRIANIQTVYRKSYVKQRKHHVPQRSIYFAQKAIYQILEKNPILLQTEKTLKNNNLPYNYKNLTHVIDVLNNISEKAILKIGIHTDKNKSKKDSLKNSQQQADKLKQYIIKRTHLAFISAIGYGKEISSKSTKKLYTKRINFHLQRIK